MKMKKLILIFLLLIFVGCGKEKEVDNKKLTNINIPINEENFCLDPTEANNVTRKNIVAQIFDTLTYMNPSKNSVSNMLTKKYTHSDDFKSWSFQIRNDITFSNGESITPKNIIASLNRTDLGKSYSNLTIKENNDAVVFSSDEPIYALDEKLADPKYAITYPDTDFNNYSRIIVSGAFSILEKKDSELKLGKNNQYWDAVNNSIETLTFSYQKDPELAYQMTTQDLYDIYATNFYDIPKDKLKNILNAPNAISSKGNDIYFLYFNKTGALNNIDLRKALIYSIERETIVSTNLTGSETPITSIFKNNSFKDYDMEKSRELFKKSGFTVPKDAKYTLIVRDGYNVRDLSTLILTNWYKLYKMPINVKILTDSSYYSAIAQGDYDIALDNYQSTDIKNFDLFNYISSVYNKKINIDISSIGNYEKSAEAVENALIANGDYTPIYRNAYFMQINPKIKFISTNIYGITYIRDIK